MSTGLRLSDANYDGLVTAWESAIEAFSELADSLSDTEWHGASGLPGWTNADVVAHVIGIERDLLGDPTPTVDLDWDTLPHADDLFSRYTELAVAERREVPRAEVLAELRKTIPARRNQLRRDSRDLGKVIRGPGGWELPRGIVLRMRIFDIWVHDQDLHRAIGTAGELDTDAAWVAADRMLGSLGYVWARKVGAAVGTSVALSVTGPGVVFHATAATAENGRGVLIDAGPEHEPTVEIAMSWPGYSALSAGRVAPSAVKLAIDGDRSLAQRLVDNLAISP